MLGFTITAKHAEDAGPNLMDAFGVCERWML